MNIVVIMTDDQTMETMWAMPQTLSLIGAAGVTFDKNVVTPPALPVQRADDLALRAPARTGGGQSPRHQADGILVDQAGKMGLHRVRQR